MSRWIKYKSAVIVFITLILFMIVVDNSQIFFGGHKLLLYHGLEELIGSDTMHLEGGIKFVLRNKNLGDEPLALDFIFQGDIDRTNQLARVDVFVENTLGGEHYRVGHFYKNKDHAYIQSDVEGYEQIELLELTDIDEQLQEDEAYFEDLYQAMVIAEDYIVDRRLGYQQSKIKTTDYTLDLFNYIEGKQMAMIEGLLNYSLENSQLLLTVHIDGLGELIYIDLILRDVNIDLEVDVVFSGYGEAVEIRGE